VSEASKPEPPKPLRHDRLRRPNGQVWAVATILCGVLSASDFHADEAVATLARAWLRRGCSETFGINVVRSLGKRVCACE
jgi:hypothetical protein